MKTKEIEPLLYNGRPMAIEPHNMALAMVAGCLKDGQSVMVQLEPGDGTHYGILITPAWADSVAPDMFYAFKGGTDVWDIPSIKHHWTRQVFAWWFSILWNTAPLA